MERGIGWLTRGDAGLLATTKTHIVAWGFCTWQGLGSGQIQISTFLSLSNSGDENLLYAPSRTTISVV